MILITYATITLDLAFFQRLFSFALGTYDELELGILLSWEIKSVLSQN